ncbi:hypothetical protein FUAX_51580 (plasmid) [Fulvitalea axinellae]|uniref:Uncharacterized protein n=1 Tax=Fulvitalea axinellae TaxID=1182444 RepID=A0AAU9CL17_9BACT|nr:hypothetical protein FUAX_51580 [Fulvitalea axinellae]
MKYFYVLFLSLFLPIFGYSQTNTYTITFEDGLDAEVTVKDKLKRHPENIIGFSPIAIDLKSGIGLLFGGLSYDRFINKRRDILHAKYRVLPFSLHDEEANSFLSN